MIPKYVPFTAARLAWGEFDHGFDPFVGDGRSISRGDGVSLRCRTAV